MPINNFMRQPKDLTKDGKCSQCAGCCACTLPVSEEELSEMKAYADSIGFTPSIPGTGDTVYLMCPFLQPKTALTVKRTCAIYDHRPNICKAFLCSQRNAETARQYAKLTYGATPMPKVINAWKAYNKTGLRLNGVEIPYDDAPVGAMEDDSGRRIIFQVGQPMNITLTNGSYIHNAMCIAILDDKLQVANENGIQSIRYESIAALNL